MPFRLFFLPETGRKAIDGCMRMDGKMEDSKRMDGSFTLPAG